MNDPSQFYNNLTGLYSTTAPDWRFYNDPGVQDEGGGVLGLQQDNTQYGDGSTSGTSTNYNPDDLAFVDDKISQLRRMYESTQNTLNDGLAGISDSYNSEQNKANTQQSRALEDFALKREDTTREKQGALGQVNTNARTLSDSVRRILGLASGSGSSAFKFAAPNAIARQASQQRNNQMETFGRNFRNLDLTETRVKSDFEQLLDDLKAQRDQKESALRSGVLGQRQDLNAELGKNYGERQRLLGGDYNDIRLARQPFTDRINSAQTELDGLFERFRNPTYRVNPVNVQAPTLDKYTVDKQALNASKQGGNPQYSPYSNFLRQKDEEERIV